MTMKNKGISKIAGTFALSAGTARSLFRLFIGMSVVIAIAGGIFFGLFSCGGYVWHKQLFNSVFTVSLICVFCLMSSLCVPLWKRFAVIVILFYLFITIRAVSSTFYPAKPESWSEFFHQFYIGFLYGPC